MRFLRLIYEGAEGAGTRMFVYSVSGGVLEAILVAVTINAAQAAATGDEAMSYSRLAIFLVCLCAYVYSRNKTITTTARIAESIVCKIRIEILDRVRNANLLQLEEIGSSHVYTALTENTQTLSAGATQVSQVMSSGVMLVCAMGYIAISSFMAFVVSGVGILLGILLFKSTQKATMADLTNANENEAKFFDMAKDLFQGFKEIRLHQGRSDNFFHDRLRPTAEETREIKVRTSKEYAKLVIIGTSFFYVLLASISFILPNFGGEDVDVVEVCSVLLFIMGPIKSLLGAAEMMSRCDVAVVNIEGLQKSLEVVEAEIPSAEAVPDPFGRFETLEVKGLGFQYPQSPDSFQLEGIDVKLKANEMVFLVGGNGTGKSTLLKLLTGLYPIGSGSLSINGRRLNGQDCQAYRNLFSTVLADFHLFDRLLGLNDVSLEIVRAKLDEMEISHKVTINDEGVISTIDLSTGQRKRLALVVALLEERPILVFDEVAADQDPEFRRKFYEELLPSLKKEGRTIIAATHDDRYFHVADRVLKMEDGKMTALETEKGAKI